jgi:glycosyltransferase involved in cell wall biosynthesis
VRIGIDLTATWRQRTGANGYALDVTRALLALDRDHDYVLYFGPAVHPDLGTLGPRVQVRVLGTRSELKCKAVLMPRLCRKDRLDVTYFPVFPPMPWPPGPTALCIHDATPWLYPDTMTFKGRWYFRLAARFAAPRASRIITYSPSIGIDIARCLGTLRCEISAIPLAGRFGSSEPECPGPGLPSEVGSRFILSVGTIEPRKNLEVALEAFRRVAAHDETSGLVWVIAGRFGWGYESFRSEVRLAGLEQRVLCLGHVSDSALRQLYCQAELMLFPSLYEGFGLPPLEAMGCGCPVVASNIAAVSEVVGDAAILVPPTDSLRMERSILAVLGDRTLRATLVEKGLQRSRCFSWARTAEETLTVLAECAIPQVSDLCRGNSPGGPEGSSKR